MPLATPADVAAEFATAWNEADAERIARLFVEDADFVNVVGLWWHRRSDIAAAHAYGFRHMFPGSMMTLEEVRRRDLSPDAAVVHARWRMRGQVTPRGEAAQDRAGIFTFVVTRSDGGWLAVAAQNTDIVPGTQTIVVEGGSAHAEHYRDAGSHQEGRIRP